MTTRTQRYWEERPDKFHLWCECCEDWIYAPSHRSRCGRCGCKFAEMQDPRSRRESELKGSQE